MDAFLQDLRYAARQLLRTPGFAFVAVLTLALGIGANTAIFSVVNSVLLRPLPFPDPDALVQVVRVMPTHRSVAMSPPDYLDLREGSRALQDIAAFDGVGFSLTGDGEPIRVSGAQTSANFFGVLGSAPALGRGFIQGENEPGAERAAILGHGLWRDRFGADSTVVGRRIRLNDVPHTVVGVLPADFRFGDWGVVTPLVYDDQFLGARGAVYLEAVGRLAPGVTIEQAAADLARVAADLEAAYPESNTNRSAGAIPLKEQRVGEVRPALLVLLGAVGLVLLIACANVANLLLARGAARQGEIAVRAALGARRGRLLRQLLTESILLAGVGGGLGLLVAYWGTDLLVAMQPANVPSLNGATVDGAVIAFTAAVAVVTGILFGIMPALQATRPDLVGSLKEGGRSARGGGRGKLRTGLVVAEIALAVVLVTGAGLLIKSFVELSRVDPGFRTERTVAFAVALPAATYPGDPQRDRFFSEFLERVEGIPGVGAAGAVLGIPMAGTDIVISYNVAGREPAPPGQGGSIQTRVATPDYFRTMGIPVVTGRGFTPDDRAGAPQVVLLNQAAVRAIFPDEDPLGQRIDMGWTRDGVTVGGEVVGIVGDVRQFGLGEDFVPEIYIPYSQAPQPSMTVVARTASDPLEVVGAVRSELAALDPALPIWNIRTLDQVLAQSVSEPRFYTFLLSIFAGMALVLSAIGIFGVMSYSVAQRTGEIGIRLALGAAPADVLGLVVRQGAALVAAGVAVGLLGAVAATRLLAGLLFGVSATDATIFVTVPAVLGLVAFVACYLPARRATRVDPMIALRSE